MHELSIVLHIVDCAEEAARSAGASRIDGIVLEIGALSGVELPALTFVWEEGVRGSLLEGAERTIVEVPGNGQCRDCGHAFAMETLYDPCPACLSFDRDVRQGREMLIRSLTIR
jgi:hydrogenase nickel incorporation protein HypA/HybF